MHTHRHIPISSRNDNPDDLSLLGRKITLTTEGFTTRKFCELILKDTSRLSKANVLAVRNYMCDNFSVTPAKIY